MGNNLSNNLYFKIRPNMSPTFYLLNSEAIDNYFSTCNLSIKNVKARNGNIIYTGNKLSPVEYNYIETFIESIYSSLPKRLINDLGNVRIIEIDNIFEGGMPHTRPGDNNNIDGIICFPNISQLYSLTTLIHELWHIHQRKYKDLWNNVFIKCGWKKWDNNLPKDLEELRRYNPDTIDSPLWIFQDKWVPIPIFRDISNPTIGDVDIWFYNPDKRIRTRNIPLDLLSYYSESLPSVAFEHPRELSAYLLSEPTKYNNVIAFKDLIKEMGAISLPYNYNN
jgi:hypothetical protein